MYKWSFWTYDITKFKMAINAGRIQCLIGLWFRKADDKFYIIGLMIHFAHLEMNLKTESQAFYQTVEYSLIILLIYKTSTISVSINVIILLVSSSQLKKIIRTKKQLTIRAIPDIQWPKQSELCLACYVISVYWINGANKTTHQLLSVIQIVLNKIRNLNEIL